MTLSSKEDVDADDGYFTLYGKSLDMPRFLSITLQFIGKEEGLSSDKGKFLKRRGQDTEQHSQLKSTDDWVCSVSSLRKEIQELVPTKTGGPL